MEERITINGTEMTYCIIRGNNSGVFAGYVKEISENYQAVTLNNARRLWYWSGAASLSQLAMEGVKNPEDCKFPCEMDEVIITDAIEIIKCSEQARLSIAEVPIWTA